MINYLLAGCLLEYSTLRHFLKKFRNFQKLLREKIKIHCDNCLGPTDYVTVFQCSCLIYVSTNSNFCSYLWLSLEKVAISAPLYYGSVNFVRSVHRKNLVKKICYHMSSSILFCQYIWKFLLKKYATIWVRQFCSVSTYGNSC